MSGKQARVEFKKIILTPDLKPTSILANHIIINDTKIARGESAQVNLNIAKLPSRTQIDIPVFVNRSSKEGPVVLLLAGLHGDEINGMEILRQMVEQNLTIPERGTIITIPILNIYGFLHFSRSLPDGKDINRSFPGSHSGSLASRVAYTLMKQVIPQIDYGIDFHTGGASKENYPQLRCVINDETNMTLAKAFQAPYLLNSRFRDKSLRKEASKLGKSIIVYEGGESMRYNNFAVLEGINGTLRLLYSLGMGNKNPAPIQDMVTLTRTSWVRARASGLFHHHFIRPGDPVKKNQLLGHITDPFGEFRIRIVAPHSGVIIGLNNLPVVNQGDALVHIGIE